MLPLREIRRREKGPTIRHHRRKTSPRRKPSSASRLRRLESGSLTPDTTAGSSPGTTTPTGTTPRSRSRSATPKTTTPPLTEEEMQISLSDIALDSWFRLVLREWDIALASRPLSVKQSYQGKMATTAYMQASQYMAPFFKHLEKRDLHPDIFPKVIEIVHHAQHRRYVTANDVYLKLSIGNAAWPIGVTMVGIHERSAREKLHEKGMAAHIMSDEVTRKYLQSIKRCLKFCQTRWPPEDQLQLMG
ncbi:Prp18 domain-containing protein [Kalaharituber pfeilii]|nr:Prp18 domain-containing protein [Kalaharituber pfeilii]